MSNEELASLNEPAETKTRIEKSGSPKVLRRHDLVLDLLESADVKSHHAQSSKDGNWRVLLALTFQSLGVVYGDLGTSPLYVYGSTFPNGIKHHDDILGVLSLVYYTLTLLPLVKYVFIVLKANDNGNGGTFALYSLLCRHAKVGLIPSQQAEDKEVSNYQLELPSNRLGWSSKVKATLENTPVAKFSFLFVAMLATSLVIGDGILTPCISVLSAVGGLQEASSHLFTESIIFILTCLANTRVVWIAVAILLTLFLLQRFGSDKVGYSFAPIISIWFILNAAIGIYNFIKYDPTVIKAVNPWYIVDYFQRNGKEAWVSLGGVVMCITGTEALFADLGHFSVRSIQLSMSIVTYPAIILQYSGQASYLRLHPADVTNAFYKAVPGPIYWPVFVIAVLAAVRASQAMISGTFSIIQQALSMGCFPRVKVIHTSAKFAGQVYIPEVNYIMMLACVCVTLGFRTTEKIGNAYGVAVVFAETITSSFMVLVMIVVWKKNILLVLLYILCIMSVELTYLSSVLYKFPHGGYLPIAFATMLMLMMLTWNYVYRKKYYYEVENKVSPETLRDIVQRKNLCRIPGLAIFYSELVHGIPPIFEHYLGNVPALHSVLVFASVKSLPISKVPPEERFLFRRVYPRELYVFRCVFRYGYTDVQKEQEPFEMMLIERLKEFIREEFWMQAEKSQTQYHHDHHQGELEHESVNEINGDDQDEDMQQNKEVELERETQEIDNACRAGVVHMMGENEVIASKGAGVGKRIVIDLAYNFLKKNLRQSDKVFDVPRKRLLKVGMTYEL